MLSIINNNKYIKDFQNELCMDWSNMMKIYIYSCISLLLENTGKSYCTDFLGSDYFIFIWDVWGGRWVGGGGGAGAGRMMSSGLGSFFRAFT